MHKNEKTCCFIVLRTGKKASQLTTLCFLGKPTKDFPNKKIITIYVLCNVNLDLYIYKWKNHFYEMKGDVGMSVHEKERKQEDAYTKTQTHS